MDTDDLAARMAEEWFDPAGPRTPRELGEDVAAVLMPVLDG